MVDQLRQANDDLRERERGERLAAVRQEEEKIRKELREKDENLQAVMQQNEQAMNNITKDFEVR